MFARPRVRVLLITLVLLGIGIPVLYRMSNPAPQPDSKITGSVSTLVPIPDQLPPTTSLRTPDASDSTVTPTPELGSHALDPVLELAQQALTQMQSNVKDYAGKLIKRERIGGKLGAEVHMEFKIRNPHRNQDRQIPLSVYLKFLEPKSARGREVIWVEGRNDNKLIGHEGGFLNLLRVELEPTGMVAMLDNKYPITEIGLLRLVEKLIEKGQRDRAVGPCEVSVHENQTVGDRTCRLIQVTHPKPDSRFDFHIAQVFMDVERMVPLRYAAFLWPEQPGAEPPLEEEYTYLDLRLNVGLTEIDFDPENSNYNYP